MTNARRRNVPDNSELHLPWAAMRVIKACHALTSGEKLLLLEVHGLDKTPERAFIGSGPLGRRLGLSRDAIEKIRRRLLAIGLLAKRKEGDRRTASWWPILPDQFIPSVDRPDDGEVAALAQALSTWVTSQLEPAPSGTPLRRSCPTPTGAAEYASAPATTSATGVPASPRPSHNAAAMYAHMATTGVPQYAPEVTPSSGKVGNNIQPQGLDGSGGSSMPEGRSRWASNSGMDQPAPDVAPCSRHRRRLELATAGAGKGRFSCPECRPEFFAAEVEA